MKGLLKKDHILLRDYFFIFLLLDITISVMNGGMILLSRRDTCVRDVGRLAVTSYILVTFVQSLINQTFNDDEKSGFLANVFTQPVTRSEYVKEKYILALQLTGIFAGIHTAGIIIGLILRTEPLTSDAMLLLAEIYILSLAGALSLSFNSISMFMKFGAGKKGIGVRVIVLLPMVMTYLIWALNVTRDNAEFHIALPAIVTLLSFALSIFLVPMSFKWAERREV